MTDDAYEECKKVMQQASYLRGKITQAKESVKKYTRFESNHREQMQPGKADAAKKSLDKAMSQLKQRRLAFAALQFPDSNLVLPQNNVEQLDEFNSN